MRVYVYSTHRAEECNLIKMLLHYGFDVTGVFDVWSRQRPPIIGVNDPEHQPPTELVAKDRTLQTISEDMSDIDFYLTMESSDFPERVEHYASMSLPIAVEMFGQESKEQDDRLIPIMQKYPNIHLVPYSPQIVNKYASLGVPRSQIHLIRFGLFPEEYRNPAWLGDLSILFCAHNSIHRRGKGCGWDQMKEIFRLVETNYIYCGNETDMVGGLGELSFDALKWMYRRCTVYLSMGTIPAPYTLTPIEAMMVGCPVVFYDNGSGILNEEWAQFAVSGGGCISNDTQQIAEYIAKVLDNTIDPRMLSQISSKIALQYFDAEKNGQLWANLINQYRG